MMAKRRGFVAVSVSVMAMAMAMATGMSGAALAQQSELLDIVQERGEIRVSTDAAYPPQSELMPDGSLQGFDIDVANEIGRRLGVKVTFVPTDWLLVDAGTWAERWDISVGSMTVTEQRLPRFDFSPAYYYTPAQVAATTASGITSLDGLSGKTVCVGEATTYQYWLRGVRIAGRVARALARAPECRGHDVPHGHGLCGSRPFGTHGVRGLADLRYDAVHTPSRRAPRSCPIGEPVFYEALAVSIDKAGRPARRPAGRVLASWKRCTPTAP